MKTLKYKGGFKTTQAIRDFLNEKKIDADRIVGITGNGHLLSVFYTEGSNDSFGVAHCRECCHMGALKTFKSGDSHICPQCGSGFFDMVFFNMEHMGE